MISSLVSRLNILLTPLEHIITRYRKITGWFLIFLAFLSFGYLTDPQSVKESGEQSMNLLWLILWIPIFARVFGIRIFQTIMPLRKELGILMGALAFVHGARYIGTDVSYVSTRDFWVQDGFLSYLGFGMFALILTIPLTLTSSLFMMRNMGKYWKYLHRSAYLIIILTVVHVILLKLYQEFEYGLLIFLIAYMISKVLEWKGISFRKKIDTKNFPKGQKWLCVPCGYIYDPLLGDEDGGIQPGTEFTDIPAGWVCPLCGVSKSDFVPYTPGETTEIASHPARIHAKNLLNPTTLELVIEVEDTFESVPGQFITFLWEDESGGFSRSYSIANRDDTIFTFLIKLSDQGRGAQVLRTLKIGSPIRIRGPFGRFVLQDTLRPKVFIGTGTGLAPLYHMITSLISQTRAPLPRLSLYFSVATQKELFYVDALRALRGLDLHIHVTREAVVGCEMSRVDIDTIDMPPETEWYLCGNPRMVAEARQKLTARGFVHVYSEEF